MTSDLTTQLRAAKPVAPPELRERVGAIASQESEKQQPAWAFPRLRMPRLRLTLVPAAALVLLVSSALVLGVARSGSPEVAGREQLDSSTTDGMERATGGTESSPALPGIASPSVADQALAAKNRAQRVTASLTVEVADSAAVSDAAQDALDLTRSLGGHIVSASVATGDEGSASLTVRVPVERVQEAIVGLSGLGRITSQRVTIDDLQESLDAQTRRAASVRSQIARITGRLASGDLDAETQAVLEARRRALRAELSQLRRGIAALDAEASMATVQLSVVTPGAAGVVPVPSRLDRTIDEALNILAWEAVLALAIAIVAAPLALLVIATWFGPRYYRRREQERLLSA
jgi:hypothetical protein